MLGWMRGDSICFYCFFFSSRRRHTRFDCDWSSDVCSSDLTNQLADSGILKIVGGVTGTMLRIPLSASWLVSHRRPGVNAGSVTAVNEPLADPRSEERRVGKEGRSGWWPEQ